MSRSGRDPGTRVKSAKGRTASSNRWLARQLNDPYVKQAKAEGWRSRAAFKLIELDTRFNLLRGARRVVDLGIAPGGWAQVVRKQSLLLMWQHCHLLMILVFVSWASLLRNLLHLFRACLQLVIPLKVMYLIAGLVY